MYLSLSLSLSGPLLHKTTNIYASGWIPREQKTIRILKRTKPETLLPHSHGIKQGEKKQKVHTPRPKGNGIPLLDLEPLRSLRGSAGTAARATSFTRRPCNHISIFGCHLFFFLFFFFFPSSSSSLFPLPQPSPQSLVLHSSTLTSSVFTTTYWGIIISLPLEFERQATTSSNHAALANSWR